MKIAHIMIEVWCDDESAADKKPTFCIYGVGVPSVDCFEHSCPYLGYTSCEDEFAYVGERGIVESDDDMAGFGGYMDPENDDEETRKELVIKWGCICRKKIREAYDEYMDYAHHKGYKLWQ